MSTATATVTIEEIKATQSRLAEMIAKLETQAIVRTHFIPETVITLKPGEHYAGTVIGHEGECSYHLILLPGAAEEVSHQAATEWAAGIDGELPNRREQALLYANLKEHFEGAWYWSSQQHESDPDYAWCQYFGNGDQSITRRDNELRARAVRRLIIH